MGLGIRRWWGGVNVWGSLEDAKNNCRVNSACGGVTCRWEGNCSLRAGTVPRHSPTGETTYVKESQDEWTPGFLFQMELLLAGRLTKGCWCDSNEQTRGRKSMRG